MILFFASTSLTMNTFGCHPSISLNVFWFYYIHPLQNVCLLALGSDNVHHKTFVVPFVKDHHCVQWKLHMVQAMKLKAYNIINVSCIIEMARMFTLFLLVPTIESMAIPL